MPAGTFDHPSCSPTSCSYFLPLAQEMNFQALSFLVLASWMLHDQAYSQPELLVFTHGRGDVAELALDR